ncbi:hypothetical protein FA13DRAFT_753591 [Coprinellus micaceus]|uniref:Uncharacterized protein n=1 Tax=Coprinellus micaceus TaxID=71717 RepID=A0A4Y7TXZ0_COPMI|nr:hypothetical protein FA13DRAFT_753591 [Coprinellus micaceus]
MQAECTEKGDRVSRVRSRSRGRKIISISFFAAPLRSYKAKGLPASLKCSSKHTQQLCALVPRMQPPWASPCWVYTGTLDRLLPTPSEVDSCVGMEGWSNGRLGGERRGVAHNEWRYTGVSGLGNPLVVKQRRNTGEWRVSGGKQTQNMPPLDYEIVELLRRQGIID